jgi:hypothetical protein
MVLTELDPAQSKLLGALTINTIEHLGSDTGVIDADGQPRTWRVVRVGGDIALVDLSADDSGPRCSNCYFVKVEDAAAIGANAKKFKVDPQRLLYSLQWRHNATPPHLQAPLGRRRRPRPCTSVSIIVLSVSPGVFGLGRLLAHFPGPVLGRAGAGLD